MQEAPVLRPLSVGDIVDRVLRLYRANPVLFFAIAVLPALISEVLQRAFGLSQTFDLNDLSSAFDTSSGRVVVPRQLQQANAGAALAVGIVAIVISVVQAGALIDAIGHRYLGRPVSIRDAYVNALRAAPRLILCGVVVGVILVAAFLAVFAAAAALNTSAFVAVAVILGLIGIFFVLPYAFLSLAVVGPAIVLEGLGPIVGIRRSFQLMKKSRLRTFGLYILIAIISSLLGLVFGVIFLASFVTEPTLRTVLQTVANVAAAAVSGPLLYGALVILYYDLRVRKEAFDLQLAAEALPREG